MLRNAPSHFDQEKVDLCSCDPLEMFILNWIWLLEVYPRVLGAHIFSSRKQISHPPTAPNTHHFIVTAGVHIHKHVFINNFAIYRRVLLGIYLKIDYFHTIFHSFDLAKCTIDFHDHCIFFVIEMYLCVFKRIHFTVVTLLSTLNKEAEIKENSN